MDIHIVAPSRQSGEIFGSPLQAIEDQRIRQCLSVCAFVHLSSHLSGNHIPNF